MRCGTFVVCACASAQVLCVLFLIAAASVYGHMANDAATKQAEMCMDQAFKVEQVRLAQLGPVAHVPLGTTTSKYALTNLPITMITVPV